jgi:hypothetical protein
MPAYNTEINGVMLSLGRPTRAKGQAVRHHLLNDNFGKSGREEEYN